MKKIYLLVLAVVFLAQTRMVATTVTITQTSFAFSPNGIFTPMTVNVGDVIHFVWTGGTHTTTSVSVPAGAASWSSPLNSSSQTFDYTITEAGDYAYECIYHAEMGMVGGFTAVEVGADCTVDVSVLANGMDVNVDATGNGAAQPNYVINWGDDSENTNASTAEHIYLVAGTFTVCVTYSDLADPDNCTIESCTDVTVQAESACTVDLTIDFDGDNVLASAVGTGAATEFYEITWGDGNSTFGSSGSHLYAEAGTYEICVNYADLSPDGCSVTDCETVIVTGGGGGGDCTLDISVNSLGLTATLTSTGNGAVNPSYTIDWGDESEIEFASSGIHTYAFEGTFNICVTYSDLQNKAGCMVTQCEQVVLTEVSSSCTVDLVVSMDGLTATATLTGDGDAAVPQYYIDWGDGTANTFAASGTHTYAAEGAFTICGYYGDLTNLEGCFATECEDILVVGIGEISFTANALRVMPNPIADNSILEIVMSKSSVLQVDVLDLVGNVVSNVMTGQRGIGVHRISFETSSLAAGVYFVRMTAGNDQKTIKVIKH